MYHPSSSSRKPAIIPQLNGVNVYFSCNGGNTSIAEAVTGENGFYTITMTAVATLITILSDPSQSKKCGVIARLRIAGCDLLPPAGFLRAGLLPVRTTTIQCLLGLPMLFITIMPASFTYYIVHNNYIPMSIYCACVLYMILTWSL
ncbi:Intimin/invasin bacterial adhesion mediator protein [Parasponia andersonii]|uniref:Intimin/invasin bacterial adhesion mediator protein n=1 Tax=Parasponia andersonii TaxID=3476 RepID=A0A2P5D3S9_PARAD|nr:Intimin/invasin bacterial adhesion mediator protein [Parasponia andersonii]